MVFKRERCKQAKRRVLRFKESIKVMEVTKND